MSFWYRTNVTRILALWVEGFAHPITNGLVNQWIVVQVLAPDDKRRGVVRFLVGSVGPSGGPGVQKPASKLRQCCYGSKGHGSERTGEKVG